MGLNSGLADVHNLAYKIAAVHHGWASDSILQSYQADRKHVAEVNSRQSVKNGKKIFGLLKTLGTAGTSDLAEARQNLFASIHDPKKKITIDEDIEGQREHFDNVGTVDLSSILGLTRAQLELHIGYVYGSDRIPLNASTYTPKYVAGARLAHAWITVTDLTVVHQLPEIDVSYVSEFSASDLSCRKYSILDLCACNAFTFILGDSKGSVWQERIQQVQSHYGESSCRFNIYLLGVDFDLVLNAEHGQAWAKNAGIIQGGGLLVRPDQHILMPLGSGTTAAEILSALEAHLGR